MSGVHVRFALGTAQFGLAYGRNLSAPVPGDEVAKILAVASARGVDALDTASAYGNAEAVIGARMPDGARFSITTKIAAIGASPVGRNEIDAVRASVRQSLQNLRVERLDTVLFHHSTDLLLPGGDALFEALAVLKPSRKIGRIGVSVYDPGDLDMLLDRFAIEVVQLPFNVLDQRFLQSGYLERLHRHNIEVQVRSIFLQGVLLSDFADLPPRFAKIKSAMQATAAAAAALGLSQKAFLLRCATANPHVSSVVVGVDGFAQFTENLDAFDAASASADLPDLSQFAVDDPNVIDPRRWS